MDAYLAGYRDFLANVIADTTEFPRIVEFEGERTQTYNAIRRRLNAMERFDIGLALDPVKNEIVAFDKAKPVTTGLEALSPIEALEKIVKVVERKSPPPGAKRTYEQVLEIARRALDGTAI